jgi:hypothetical protein
MVANKKIKLFIIHCLIPTFIGFLIYICFRSKELNFFKWLSIFNSEIDFIRYYTLKLKVHIPKWVYFSLVDALWCYSLTSSIMIYWISDSKRIMLIIWLIIVFLISILHEILQFFDLYFVKGTFDYYDLVLCIISYIYSILYFLIKFKKNEKN